MANKSEIIEFLSQKYHVSEDVIEKAVNSQFKFAKEKMQHEDFPTVRIPYFGKFIVNKKKLKHIKEHERNKTNRTSQQSKEES